MGRELISQDAEEAEMMLSPSNFFRLDDDRIKQLFSKCERVWEALTFIEQTAAELAGPGPTILGAVGHGAYVEGDVYVGEGARVESGVYIEGPAYIGQGALVRQGAYIRGGVILFEGSMLGHAGEAKNAVLLPGAKAPHFAYVGDSILGHSVNLGAGTILSNLTVTSIKDPATGERPSLQIRINDIDYDTGLSKFGAILGDGTQTGCNAVLNPGTLVGRSCLIYPNVSLRKGYYPSGSIVKLRQDLEIVPRQE
jgi:NDP-sugar pyrophosphorylase family protein